MKEKLKKLSLPMNVINLNVTYKQEYMIYLVMLMSIEVVKNFAINHVFVNYMKKDILYLKCGYSLGKKDIHMMKIS